MISKKQQEIIDTPGNLIVQASAGTGKTHTLASKLMKEIEENRSHKSVAAVTFTVKAAGEIRDKLKISTFQHFIGTNNSFAISEIIRPFMRDVYGPDFQLDFDTDYSMKFRSFEDGIEVARERAILGSYEDNDRNFIFQLAHEIVWKSSVCRMYLQSKFFKIYVDEYQDCDKDMHTFFMFLCDQLNIELFVVGDEKQSIYMWRGAKPELFLNILKKENFKSITLDDNFRSSKQIQNYSNIISNNGHLYNKEQSKDVMWCEATEETWVEEISKHLDIEKEFAILRFSNKDANRCAREMENNGIPCAYVPIPPISEISTESAWLYASLAKYCILQHYSVYDFINEMPQGGDMSRKKVSIIKEKIDGVLESLESPDIFRNKVSKVAIEFGYPINEKHINLLFSTVKNEIYHISFSTDKPPKSAMTFHSSKGLEYEQIVLFAQDYNLGSSESIRNHYVASTRAKSKLIIVGINSRNMWSFRNNIEAAFNSCGVPISDVLQGYQ